MRSKFPRTGLALAAIDLLSALFAISYRQPPKPAAVVRTYGTYAVILTWPKKCNADLDLYLRQPDGEVVYYNHLNGSIAHLEHDDIPGAGLGYRNQGNFERIVLRGYQPGEYVANAHIYSPYDCRGKIPARVELWRLTGDDREITSMTVTLQGFGSERTAFRFSLRKNGDTYGINHLQRDLVG